MVQISIQLHACERKEKVGEVSTMRLRLSDSYGVVIDPRQDNALILAVAVCIKEIARRGR